jgi:LAO/AO transport system kinase
MDIFKLKQAILGHSKRALAQAISLIENGDTGVEELLDSLRTAQVETQVIGVTGPPGAGKSSLIDQIALTYTQKNYQVAILAIDPSSAFTGGSILGDRIRMSNAGHAGVFIRSMASRASSGGLAPAVEDTLELLGAAGYNLILIETVGAGQTDIAIRDVAHTVLVLTVPGLGDGIQALKAGVMEIGDIFAVNKSDLQGVDQAIAALRELNMIKEGSNGWDKPIIKVSTKTSEGLNDLIAAIDRHFHYLKNNNLLEARRLCAIQKRLEDLVSCQIIKSLKEITGDPLKVSAEEVLKGSYNIFTARDKILTNLLTSLSVQKND